MMMRTSILGAVVLALTLGAPMPAAAAGARYALLVQGASGEPQYAAQHRAWLDALASLFSATYKYDPKHLVVLAEQPKAGEERATAVGVKAALSRLAASMTADDQLAIILIGHGSALGTDVKFNLIGPDLGVAEWSALLKPVPGRLVIVDTTSASFPYLAGLSAPGRVVVTATNSAAQRYATAFPDGFIQAMKSAEADLDKNGRVSVLEAFTFASRFVKQQYEQKGTMATETAMLDDNGDGKGREASAEGPDGGVARIAYLDSEVVPANANPELAALIKRRQALEQQAEEHKQLKGVLPDAEWQSQFEKLMLELAQVSAEIRKKS